MIPNKKQINKESSVFSKFVRKLKFCVLVDDN